VLLTVASQGNGVRELVDQFEMHLTFLENHGGLEARRRQRYEQRIIDLLRERLWDSFRLAVPDAAWTTLIDGYFAEHLSPLQIAERLIGPNPRDVLRNGEVSLTVNSRDRRRVRGSGGKRRASPNIAVRDSRPPLHRAKASR